MGAAAGGRRHSTAARTAYSVVSWVRDSLTISGDTGHDSVGGLRQTNGVGDSFVIVRYSRMAVSRARVLRWVPRLICFSVSVANHRSTRFRLRRACRGEVDVEAWVGDEPASHARRLVCAVVEDEMDGQHRRHVRIDGA